MSSLDAQSPSLTTFTVSFILNERKTDPVTGPFFLWRCISVPPFNLQVLHKKSTAVRTAVLAVIDLCGDLFLFGGGRQATLAA